MVRRPRPTHGRTSIPMVSPSRLTACAMAEAKCVDANPSETRGRLLPKEGPFLGARRTLVNFAPCGPLARCTPLHPSRKLPTKEADAPGDAHLGGRSPNAWDKMLGSPNASL